MIKLTLVLAALSVFVPATAIAVQTEPVPAMAPAPAVAPAPAAVPAPPAAPVDMANDPRMIAAIRHANARADAKCGTGAGLGVVDLQTKMAARTCRRHMVEAARLDTESEIGGH